MIDGLLFALTLLAALGCGLIAGVFFAFSAFVMMKALARLPSAQGIAAMQSINVAVLNPLFFTAFFGTAAACVGLAAWSPFRWHEPGAVSSLVGSVLYLVGTMLVTIVANVPRNDALATVEPDGPDAEKRWARYVASWSARHDARGHASERAEPPALRTLAPRRS